MLANPSRRVRLAVGAAVTAVGTFIGSFVLATPAFAASQWLAVSVGYNSACAIKTDSTLWCWGDNTYGKLGLGDQGSNTRRLSPTLVLELDLGWLQQWFSDWATVSVGRDHACGVRRDGTGYCWGSNLGTGLGGSVPNGKLGLGGSTQYELRPAELPGRWRSLAAGSNHTCGIDTGGGRWCWGQNAYGQLGTGDTGSHVTPYKISSSGWVSISAGQLHTCGVKVTGSTYCWGMAASGQLGNGVLGTRPNPQPVELSPDSVGDPPGFSTDWTAPTAGQSHSCDITNAGLLFCWGSNADGQLGQGTSGGIQATPQGLSGSAGDEDDWATVSAGYTHNCAVRDGGQLYCWGGNQYGQLGVGDLDNRVYATRIPTGTWQSVSAGWKHSCGLRTSGTLYCWGYNFHGELGLGDQDSRRTPAQVP